MIEVKGLHKAFGTKQVLEGVDAVFRPGECSLIIGKSGVGKTVLMRSIVGLEEADSGEILFDGRDMQQMGAKEIQQLRQESGMLFQNAALFDSMDVLENVLFPLNMFSRECYSAQKERARECLERVQMYEARYKYPGEISGGMKKRTAIARAIALRPKYLFCDEPTSGLDPETAKIIDQLLLEITREEGMTTLVNTHDMNSVANIGDHVLFIHQGHVWWEGKGSEIEATGDMVLKNFVFISKL